MALANQVPRASFYRILLGQPMSTHVIIVVHFQSATLYDEIVQSVR